MELKHAALAFGALSHPVRLELFRVLAREGPNGLPAGELARQMRMPPSTLSFHLHEMTGVGLLAGVRDGRIVRYRVEAEQLRQLLWFLGEDCCQGRADLVPAPTARIERRLQEAGPGERETVLFLCTHNSARSQMAEALLRARAGDRLRVLSAGMRPRAIHPLTLVVLNEIGVPTDDLTPTDLGAVLGKMHVHHAIVLCPEAQEQCPRVVPFAQQTHYWPFPDPSRENATRNGQLQLFRAVRDALQARLDDWLARPGAAGAQEVRA